MTNVTSYDNADGPYVVWQDYGCEGWKPTSYLTLPEAVLGHKYQNRYVITKIAEFRIAEVTDSTLT